MSFILDIEAQLAKDAIGLLSAIEFSSGDTCCHTQGMLWRIQPSVVTNHVFIRFFTQPIIVRIRIGVLSGEFMQHFEDSLSGYNSV